MDRVKQHYDRQLASIYTWMAGGLENAVVNNRQLFQKFGVDRLSQGLAIDLGADSGFQSIPLAQLGFSVVAIDFCGMLLSELKEHCHNLAINTVEDNILNFDRHINKPAELIVCMGDTLTHLESLDVVRSLLSDIVTNLANNGRLILAFRDYVSVELEETQRFIPVRSDDSKILTCFLEYKERYVKVYDILYQKELDKWSMEVSSYRKLRLSPSWVKDYLEENSLTIIDRQVIKGMVYLVASKE